MSLSDSKRFLTGIAQLRAAAEPTRLRILALLSRAELTVGEICDVLSQSQPRVSRHLKLLTDAGLIDRLREQYWVYYRVPADALAQQAVEQLLSFVDADDEVFVRDRQRMERVLGERVRRAAAASAADPRLSEHMQAVLVKELGSDSIGSLLDVGTGAGHMLELLAGRATRAVGVDISSDALRLARTNIYGAGLRHCELRRGDMYDLPFEVPSFDVATVGRVLAAADEPVRALTEIARTLKHDGRLLLIDDFDALEKACGGNPIATLRQWFATAGLEFVRVHPLDTEHGHLLIAVGRRRIAAATAAA
ncbi:MAG TPA: metalloregulator ArsR/SmtB family transcription factor [Steroidobacteraceae bacterium]|nr:metalloregulator ArsR/SmtB family transcription factor [Steroidobacteraceae bacterium]